MNREAFKHFHSTHSPASIWPTLCLIGALVRDEKASCFKVKVLHASLMIFGDVFFRVG